MNPMQDQTELDEYLEVLYHLWECHHIDLPTLKEHRSSFRPEALAELARRELIVFQNETIDLTDKGFRTAEKIIRRHRLAERLLADVLHMSPEEVEAGACEFEHMVAEEIADSICILLGHPRTCPHGSAIPQGRCCQQHSRECLSAAIPLLEMPIGIWGRIAYICSENDDRQHRLGRLGVLPGRAIKVHQVRPSLVAILESSRVAMEESIARDIFVWRKWDADATAAPPVPPRKSWVFFPR
jgi:DtxR family Mn-dependent transcriptional regulator